MENYNPPELTIRLSDETIQKWKAYLFEHEKLIKEEKHQEMIKRLSADPNYEKYRAAVLTDGRTERDYGFESLFLLHKMLEETPFEKLKEYSDSAFDGNNEGITVEEYFESLNPSVIYQKGYTDGATKFKEAVIKKIKEDIALSEDVYDGYDVINLLRETYNNNG